MKQFRFIPVFILTLVLCAVAAVSAYSAVLPLKVVPSKVRMFVDQDEVPVDAYNIAGYNYFKLRCLAKSVNCAVWYDDQAREIHIDSSKPYDMTYAGAAESDAADGVLQATLSSSSVIVDDVPVYLEVYMINGYNYFKLRDFIQAVNMDVWFDNGIIFINTGRDPDYTPPYVPPAPKTTPAAEKTPKELAQAMAELVNIERKKAGVSPVSADNTLMEAAQYRCWDMNNKGYFSHVSPSGEGLADLLNMFNIDWKALAANLATGLTSPEEVMRLWMDGQDFRNNILNRGYGRIGVGYMPDGGPQGSIWLLILAD